MDCIPSDRINIYQATFAFAFDEFWKLKFAFNANFVQLCHITNADTCNVVDAQSVFDAVSDIQLMKILVSDVGDNSCGSVHFTLEFVCCRLWFTGQQTVAVVDSFGDERVHQIVNLFTVSVSVGKLNVHLRIHRCSSAKNFRCTEDECQKMFFSQEGLRRHKLTHLGIQSTFHCRMNVTV